MKKTIARWVEKALINKDVGKELYTEYLTYNKERIQHQFHIFLYSLGSIALVAGLFSLINANALFPFFFSWLYNATIPKVFFILSLTIVVYILEYRYAYKRHVLYNSNALFIASSVCIAGTYIVLGQVYKLHQAYALFCSILWISIFPLAIYHNSKWLGRITTIILIGAFFTFNSRTISFGINHTAFLTISLVFFAIMATLKKWIPREDTYAYLSYKHGALLFFLGTWIILAEFLSTISSFSEYIYFIPLVQYFIIVIICIFILLLFKEQSNSKKIAYIASAFVLVSVLFLQEYTIVYQTMQFPKIYTLDIQKLSINRLFMVYSATFIFFVSTSIVLYKNYGKDIFSTIIALGFLFIYAGIQYLDFDYTVYEKASALAIISVFLFLVSYLLEKNTAFRNKKKIRKTDEKH